MQKEILPIIPLTTPLENIALTFSGGGFRAASYSLGTLAYLNHIKFGEEGKERSLLKNVTYISSTSGGSITNALYSSYIHKGKTFADVYKKLMACLTGQQLLDEVFSVMKNDNEWNVAGNYKARNFINAFAKVYDRLLYGEEIFGVFWNEENIKEFEICLNSTEFYRGLSFRFQTEGSNNTFQKIGNNYLHFDATKLDIVKKIKLADMVAASSCFPAGFEPIVYPEDFSYANKKAVLSIEDLKHNMIAVDYQETENPIEHSFGLMDGGITDNQGLKSAMTADEKRRRRKRDSNPFDLIMVTDVTSYFMDEYKEPAEQLKPPISKNNIDYYIQLFKGTVSSLTKKINWGLLISIVILIASIATIGFTKDLLLQNVGSFFCGFSLLLFIVIIMLKKVKLVRWIFQNKDNIETEKYLNDFIKNQKFISEKILLSLIHFLRFTKIGLLEKMIKSRVASMLSMLLDVNLKQTRRLIYELFYDDQKWENRRASNFIYELSTLNNTSRTHRFNNTENPFKPHLDWDATAADKALLLYGCDKLLTVAEEARTMGTTLWFDEKNEGKLKQIIATGQFTTCCNLLEYVISLERKGIAFDTDTNKQLANLKAALTIDFLAFKKDPYFLYDKMQKM
jgi:predicted acylesterase/phospholipase RssA